MTDQSISVVVPAFNEEPNVERTVESAIRPLEDITADFEIVIVNDGSADATGQVAESLAHRYPAVRVIHHEKNRGYGAALSSGYYAAKKQWVCLFPADGQFDMREIERLLPLTDRFDVVTGYRVNRADPFHRKLNAFLYNSFIRVLFGVPLRDIDCGFKIIRRRLFDKIRLTSTGAFVDAEFYILAKALGARITEVGVTHYPREQGEQTGARISVILRMFKELWIFRRKMKSEIAALRATREPTE